MFMKNIAEFKAASYKAHQDSQRKNYEEASAIKKNFHLRALLKSFAK